MAKAKSRSTFARILWRHHRQSGAGRCESCGEWNSIMVEEAAPGAAPGRRSVQGQKRRASAMDLRRPRKALRARRFRASKTGIAEFDRVAGGGLVPGSALLGRRRSQASANPPYCWKPSPSLRRAAAPVGSAASTFSGEEAIDQVRLRARAYGAGGRAGPARCRHFRCATSLASLEELTGRHSSW